MREHGARAKYVVEKCRCEACTAANRQYARVNSRQRAMRQWGAASGPFAAAAPVRRHLLALRADGLGLRRISEATGVGRTALNRIMTGRQTVVRPETAQRILRVEVAPLAGGALVPADVPVARLLAIRAATGWTWKQLGQRLGMTTSNTQGMTRRARMTARRARQINELWIGLGRPAEVWGPALPRRPPQHNDQRPTNRKEDNR